jgi:hypothetical protein
MEQKYIEKKQWSENNYPQNLKLLKKGYEITHSFLKNKLKLNKDNVIVINKNGEDIPLWSQPDSITTRIKID